MQSQDLETIVCENAALGNPWAARKVGQEATRLMKERADAMPRPEGSRTRMYKSGRIPPEARTPQGGAAAVAEAQARASRGPVLPPPAPPDDEEAWHDHNEDNLNLLASKSCQEQELEINMTKAKLGGNHSQRDTARNVSPMDQQKVTNTAKRTAQEDKAVTRTTTQAVQDQG